MPTAMALTTVSSDGPYRKSEWNDWKVRTPPISTVSMFTFCAAKRMDSYVPIKPESYPNRTAPQQRTAASQYRRSCARTEDTSLGCDEKEHPEEALSSVCPFNGGLALPSSNRLVGSSSRTLLAMTGFSWDSDVNAASKSRKALTAQHV
jgi:hypothetical protein